MYYKWNVSKMILHYKSGSSSSNQFAIHGGQENFSQLLINDSKKIKYIDYINIYNIYNYVQIYSEREIPSTF